LAGSPRPQRGRAPLLGAAPLMQPRGVHAPSYVRRGPHELATGPATEAARPWGRPRRALTAPPAEAGRMRAAPWPRTLPGSSTPGRPMRGRAPLLSRWEMAASQSATVRATWPAAGRPRGQAAAVPRAVRHGLPRAGHEPGRRRRREPDRPWTGHAPGRERRRAPGRPLQAAVPRPPPTCSSSCLPEEDKEERERRGKWIGLGFYPPYLYEARVNLGRPS